MPVDVIVPAVGESITEVFIGTWLKKQGDRVTKDEPIVEIETDKATLEVPATVGGVLSEVLKAEGEGAAVGEAIARIQEGASEASASAPAASAPVASAPVASASAGGEASASKAVPSPNGDAGATPATRADQAETSRGAPGKAEAAPAAAGTPADETPPAGGAPAVGAVVVMPAAQRVLDENNLTAADVTASGPGGRILKEDVLRVLAERERQAAVEVAPKVAGPTSESYERQEDVVPMSPLRRKIAQRLVEAQHSAALLTTFNEVDMSAVMELRKEYREAFEARHGTRLGFMSFFVKAVIEALKQVPQLNAEVREQSIVYKNYYDIGVAVSTKKGLIVPVIRNAERLSFAEVEKAIADFGVRATTNKLTPDELTGGTFTISNGGVFGSLMSTPIVNPPQSGVLGMHTIQQRPVAEDGVVVIRPMMYIALTYDHRVVDGREAVTFLKRVKENVERPTRILLEV